MEGIFGHFSTQQLLPSLFIFQSLFGYSHYRLTAMWFILGATWLLESWLLLMCSRGEVTWLSFYFDAWLSRLYLDHYRWYFGGAQFTWSTFYVLILEFTTILPRSRCWLPWLPNSCTISMTVHRCTRSLLEGLSRDKAGSCATRSAECHMVSLLAFQTFMFLHRCYFCFKIFLLFAHSNLSVVDWVEDSTWSLFLDSCLPIVQQRGVLRSSFILTPDSQFTRLATDTSVEGRRTVCMGNSVINIILGICPMNQPSCRGVFGGCTLAESDMDQNPCEVDTR